MIDYSAIPLAKPSGGPWNSLKWALIIVLGISSILALGALITEFTGHRDIVMPIISGILFFGFIGIIIGAFRKSFNGFKQQNKWMQEFAKDNKWQYDDSKRTVNDLQAFPVLYHDVSSNWSDVRCTVSGKLNGKLFELSHITYQQSTGLKGLILNNYIRNRYRIAWTSVLRVEGHPILHKNKSFLYEKDSNYTYVICKLNTLYRNDIQTMFQSII